MHVQDVLRNWHSRDSKIIETMAGLVANARKAADAFRNGKQNHWLVWPHPKLFHVHSLCSIGDLELIGDCLNTYRGQKLIMAPGMHAYQGYTLLCVLT